jgi:transposase-like protein
MDKQITMRLRWVELYDATGNTGFTCRRCGISRPTLRLWYRRWQNHGIEGLASRSRRPKSSPNQKRTKILKKKIPQRRKKRNLGARRIQSELIREIATLYSLGRVNTN